MQRNKDILIELQELSPILAGINPVNVFSVPEGYFEHVSEEVITKVRSDSDFEGFHGKFPKSNPQQVPAGYFEGLSQLILSRIKENQDNSVDNELRALSLKLAAIKKTNVFSVPEGYFEKLPHLLVKKLIDTKPAKVVSIPRRKIWIRYAVAAVITGIMAMSAWMIIAKPFISEGKKFLAEVKSIKNQYKTEEDIQNALATISNKDIIKYLDATGDITDIELITPNINTSELPSETDYFDQEFLDSFINELESPQNNN